jgi:signal transduction histidine kinase
VLVSNALLRESLRPGIQRIGATAFIAYLVALTLVYIAGEFTRINLARIGKIIDRIGSGATGALPPPPAAAEFAAVESKLSLMQDRVRSYRQRVDALLEKLEEAVLVADGGKLVLAAGPVDQLLGIRASEINGRPVDEVFPPSTGVSELLRSKVPVRNALVRHNRGLTINIDYMGNGEGGRGVAVIRLRDAEGASELHSQFEISSRLEAINRLTGGVAHEIKNPLNSIAARLGLLESIVEGDREAEREIQIISGEIERLDRVVRTFLDFTQPLEIVRRDIDMVALAREVVEFVAPDARRKEIAAEFTSEAGSVTVCGDRDLLRQAMLNLAVNAIEAMDSGGRLSVDVARDGQVCRLRVIDNGPGIPESVRPKIFRLYFTTKPNGSGIGLAVAYRTLQLHGGDLQLDTRPGEGSTFTLTVPIVYKEVAATA